MNVEDLIERLVAINLKPGDVVWMQTPEVLSMEQIDSIRTVLRDAFPDHKIIVTPPGFDISAFREVESA